CGVGDGWCSRIENGPSDGIALVNNGIVVEFLSYEGVFTATNGPANGMQSIDIGVAETSTTPIGMSLQRINGVWMGPLSKSFGKITPVIISEIHYDNDGTDVGEAIELQAEPGTLLTDWELWLYEGEEGE